MSTLPDDYLEFKKDDFQRGVLVKVQGWHPVKIKTYEKKRTADGNADLHVYTFEGLDEDTKRPGVFLIWRVSSNAPKNIHAMIVRALDPEASKQDGYKYNPANSVGKTIEGYINHRRMDKDDPDSLTNNFKDFRAVGKK